MVLPRRRPFISSDYLVPKMNQPIYGTIQTVIHILPRWRLAS
jgi:hypothetical protein